MAQLAAWMRKQQRVVTNRRIALRCSLLLCATLALLTATSLFAQPEKFPGVVHHDVLAEQDDGAIQGTVTDNSGAFVAGVVITATNTKNGIQYSRRTDQSGACIIRPLRAGNYNVEVNAKGFQRLLQENVKVEAHRAAQVALKLTPGSEPLTITLTDKPMVIGHNVTSEGESIAGNLYTQTPSRSSIGSFQDLIPGVTMTQNSGSIQGTVTNSTAAAVPLFRDPIHDGAADPVVVWNRARKTWWMLYTNRRADLAGGGGVTWVHGTHIGIAESADGGAHWKYVSEADIPVPAPDYTLWAPEIIDTGGTYHMFLTVVPGTFTDWNHPRHILPGAPHLASEMWVQP